MGSVHEFLYKNLILLVSAYLIPLFLYFIRLFRRNLGFREKKFGDLRVVLAERYEQIELKRRLGEEEDQEIVEFSFKFPNFEEINGSKRDDFDEFVDELEADVEEKEAPHEEIFEDSNERVDWKVDEQEFNQESVYSYVNSHTDSFTSKNIHLSISNPIDTYDDDDDDDDDEFEDDFEEKEAPLEDLNEKVDLKVDEQKFNQESVYSYVNSCTDSFTSKSISNPGHAYGGGDDDDDFEEKEALHEDSDEKVDQKVDEQKFNQESVYSYVNSHTYSITSKNIHLSISNPVDVYRDDDFEEKLENSNKKVDQKVDEQKFHQETVYSYVNKDSDSITSSNFHSSTSNTYGDGNDFGTNSIDLKESEEKTADSNNKNRSNDSRNKLESLMEHQELIEQLKMEIKKVKVIGLPTIFEESESPPKIMGLQPWKKIEEESYHNVVGHKLNEVDKFYKIYKERMRKFDIFSYQKMYATGFLKLNDPFQSVLSSRSLVPEITTHLCRRFSSPKIKKHERNPTRKFIKELQNDLEVVYVGQMCLSWEILRWQYEKVLEIWESDPRGVHQFYEVSGEFQRFLVLMQRFLEEEPFHGPRVQNYTKTRCVFRNLLQVPLVREDGPKNRRKARSQVDGNDMSCDMLVEILEESIRLFWRFIRADKDTRKTPLEFQKPEDSHLFMEVQKDLHKKEKKLKEQLRSGNCILKRLRSWKEGDSHDQVLWFFSQIDLKLVARVLQMSKLTPHQLFWCQNQLKKVRFFNRKIHVEPSFLLFPC